MFRNDSIITQKYIDQQELVALSALVGENDSTLLIAFLAGFAMMEFTDMLRFTAKGLFSKDR